MKKLLLILLSNFIAFSALAEGGAPAGGSPYTTIIMIVVFIAIFYFLLIRPQTKRQKEQKAMLTALAKGDEVITTAGIVGKITKMGDNYIEIAVSENSVIKFQKNAVMNVLPKGSANIT